jgi:hypothetical protein
MMQGERRGHKAPPMEKYLHVFAGAAQVPRLTFKYIKLLHNSGMENTH